jgi:hypothetical protein
MILRTSIVVISFLCLGSFAYSQRNFSLYNLDNTPQAHYLNPAFRPGANFYISIPLGMQSFGVSHSGFTVNDLLQTRSYDDSLELRPDIAIEKMAKVNHINVEAQNELFGMGIRFKKNYVSFSVTNRTQFNFLYSRDLFKFALQGNGKEFIGQRASLDGLGVNLNSYIEYGVGYNREINKKLAVGARFKLLSGIANVHTSKSQLGIYTDPEDFDLTIDGSMRVNTANIAPFYEDSTGDFYNTGYAYAYNFQNKGFGIDLGATYQVSKKLQVNASIVDLGFINWQTNTKNYVSNEVNYTFQGIDLNGFFTDSIDVLERLTDSLEQVFSQTENTDSYTTSLYTRFYIGAQYQLNKQFNGNILLYNEFVNKRYRPGLILSMNTKLGQWLTASVNYSIYGRSFTNLGLGLSLRGGPIQWYITSDNFLGFMFPQASKNLHIMTGFGIMIGKPDKDKGKTATRVDEEKSK